MTIIASPIRGRKRFSEDGASLKIPTRVILVYEDLPDGPKSLAEATERAGAEIVHLPHVEAFVGREHEIPACGIGKSTIGSLLPTAQMAERVYKTVRVFLIRIKNDWPFAVWRIEITRAIQVKIFGKLLSLLLNRNRIDDLLIGSLDASPRFCRNGMYS